MKWMVIHGGKSLEGDVWIGGAKNSTIALIPAPILSWTLVALEGVPRIANADNLMDLFSEMDAGYDLHKTTLRIDLDDIKRSPLPTGKIKSLRTSYYSMGVLLGRFGKTMAGFPGGDGIGPRPTDQHTKGFGALGATVEGESDQTIITAPRTGLRGVEICLKMPSVGTTVNIAIVSVMTKGQTTIENTAKRPEIIDLATFLDNMGAVVRGAGTDVIRIEGVEELRAQIPHTVIPDWIEAGTYVALAAYIGDGIRIHDIIEEHPGSYLAKVEEMGVIIDADEDSLYVYPIGDLKMVQVKTGVYPGSATDLQQPVTPLLLTIKVSKGVVVDRIYPKRVGYIPELRKMGANIRVEDNIILVCPTHHLHGARVDVGETRTGVYLMLVGLMADGETIISNAGSVLRGYDRIEQKLHQLGAKVSVIDV